MKLQITFNILLLVTLSYSAPYFSGVETPEEFFEDAYQQLLCTLNTLDELVEEYECLSIWARYRPNYMRALAEYMDCDELNNGMESEAIYNGSDVDIETPYSL